MKRKMAYKMILSLVEDAVEIKIHFENFTGMLQSNYELGYALGKMMKILNLPLDTGAEIEKLKEKIETEMQGYLPKDFIEENLMKIIREYRIQSPRGEEIKQLIEDGYNK